MLAATAIALLLGLGVVVMGRGAGADAPAAPIDLALSEVLTAPAVDMDGIVFSVAVRNEADVPLTVRHVEAVADAGVTVEVLGASTCRGGCAGALPWWEAESMMARSIEWTDAFTVPPEADVLDGRAAAVKVVLRVRPADEAAQQRLASSCLFVRELLVRVGDGMPQAVRNGHADFVVALDRPDAGGPDAPSRCPASEWAPAPAD